VPVSTTRYEIDPAQTKVTVLVRRAGALARLGHNHAIVSGEERGVIWIGSTLQASGFEIHVPVRSFDVDDPDARAAAGPEFPGAVPDDARSGTAANMLRAEVLDAEHYPEIVVRADGAAGTWQQAVVHATVRVKDMPREYDVPVALSVSDGIVEASGAFQIRQTDFGITPFSVAGGAVQVADPVDIRFSIRGVRHVGL
jgi:polyisoprenoid-binding protein YceI